MNVWKLQENGTEVDNTGNKKDNITVIYTPWSNLKKDGSMATGQVGFKDQKKVKRVYVAKRENPIVNRLNKTKVEKFPDFRQEKEDRAKELRKKDRSVIAARVRIAKPQSERDTLAYTITNRQRKRLALQRRGKSWHIKENTLTTTGTWRNKSWLPATRTVTRTGRTTSCENSHVYKIKLSQNTKVVGQSCDSHATNSSSTSVSLISGQHPLSHAVKRPTTWVFDRASAMPNNKGLGICAQRSFQSRKEVVGLFRHARGTSAASKTIYTSNHRDSLHTLLIMQVGGYNSETTALWTRLVLPALSRSLQRASSWVYAKSRNLAPTFQNHTATH